MAAPEDVPVAGAEVWWAPVGETRPGINDTPTANWAKLSAAGNLRYGEKGVVIRAPRTTTDINVVGSTVPIKQVVTAASFEVEVDVLDFRKDTFALGAGFDPDDITDTAADAGEPGFSNFTLPTNPVPFQAAILVRFPSPDFAGGNAEYYIPTANQVGNMDAAFVKDGAAFVTHIWRAVNANGWVQYRTQTAAVSP